MVENNRFVFRGMNRCTLGESEEMLPGDITSDIALSAALTQKRNSVFKHRFIFTSLSINVAKWYAEDKIRRGLGASDSVYLIDTKKINKDKIFSHERCKIVNKKNATTKTQRDYICFSENGEPRSKSIGLTAYNNMKSSKMVVFDGICLTPDYYVELPPLIVDMLSIIESMGLSKEEFQSIVERQFYLLKDDKDLTDEELVAKNKHKAHMSISMGRSLNNVEKVYYDALYRDKPPQTVEEIALKIQNTFSQLEGTDITLEHARVLAESMRDNVIQKMVGCELIYTDMKTKDYDIAKKYLQNIYIPVGRTKRGAIFDESVEPFLENKSKSMLYDERKKKPPYESDLNCIFSSLKDNFFILAGRKCLKKSTRGEVSEVVFNVPYLVNDGGDYKKKKFEMTVNAKTLISAILGNDFDKKKHENDKKDEVDI